jgi:hypothetical protein
MGVMTAAPKGHPLMIAWEKYQATADFANTRKWATQEPHTLGSLWAAFASGWNAHSEQAVDNSDDEPPALDGCGP